jgi:hypothetical protein
MRRTRREVEMTHPIEDVKEGRAWGLFLVGDVGVPVRVVDLGVDEVVLEPGTLFVPID